MGINTGDLHSGMTSAQPKTSIDRKRELIAKSLEDKHKLAPYAEVVDEIVKADQDAIVKQLRTMILEPLPEEAIKVELLVLQRMYAYTESLNNRIANILRTREQAPKEETDVTA